MSPGRCRWLRRAGWQLPLNMCGKRRGCCATLALLWMPPALLLLLAVLWLDPLPGQSRQEGTVAVSGPPSRVLPPPEPFAEDVVMVAAEGPVSSRPGEWRSGRRKKRVYRLVRAGKRGRWGAAASQPGRLPTPERRMRGFNEVVSERISLHRRPPEVRDPLCLQQEYSQNLPSASIIICFHNEAWSTLLRTVNSVMDTVPKEILKEIILVDDLSNQGHLKAALSEYISKLVGVRLIRSNRRLGVIGGRMLGAARATGDVLIFMDSHCECHNGWLEPLLDRIAFDRTRVVSPVIDVIDWKTFQYYHSVDPQRGAFNWKLDFHWEPIPEYQQKWRKSPINPIQSPAISGGVLGINRHYFQNIGAYDPGMLIGGLENVELSLRVWLCGGSVEVLPCSRVGHVYQKHSHDPLPDEETTVKNKIRVAEVWLDSFKEIFYKRDLTAYLLSKLYNIGTGFCADYETKWSTSGYPIVLAPCSGNGNQHFEYNSIREIRFGAMVELCIDVRDDQVILQNCTSKNRMESQQQWNVQKSGEIIHVFSGKCIEAIRNATSQDLFLRPCNKSATHQLWRFEQLSVINER
ncbi:polypeptide N-acetylgalactosaminyltransferase 15-like isoform X3 [Hypanus sabinus]|uniref:polypeptide N-acetylgalactosaminyltransferase 15-like isoform X3 n=1 Tax=Hypanus sabinus TaxID=79690 RepID=UPI0028C492E3|nr:polypeptide N-acetylgalactosaminyltransferase 15-like isoform X3 [Hypanus sabinus]